MTKREVLARALYLAGPIVPMLHVPTVAWDRLPVVAQRQWLEAADYLLAALEHAHA